MAKQNPATDPVSAAMSAIESALNLTEDDEAVTVESAAPPQLVPAKTTTATPVLKPSPLAAEPSTLLRPGPAPAPIAPETEAKPAIPDQRAGKRRPRDRRGDPAGDERTSGEPDAIHPRPDRLAPVGGDLRALRLCRPVALGSGAPGRHAVAAGDPALPAGDAGADLLHVRLRRAHRGGCASSGSRRARSPRSPCVWPSPRRRPASTWRTSPRPFVASLRRWAMGSNGRLRAPPNSRPGCSPRFRPLSAPIPTMSAGSGC